MKKVIQLQDVDCANCAAKVERAIQGLPEVISCKVNFLTQKMTLEAPAEQFEAVLKQAKKSAKRIDRDIVFLEK